MRELGKYLAGFVVAGFLLWWVLRGIDAGLVWRHLAGASVPGVLLCAGLNLGHNVFRVWRWRALLEPVHPGTPFRPMFVAVIVGYMTTWVVPGRLGELVRPLLLTAREQVPLGPCVGSVVADRLLDASAVVALFVVGSWITPLDGRAAEYAGLIRSGALLLAGAMALGVTAMLVASASERRVNDWLDRRSRALRWLGRTALSLSAGVGALRSPRLIVRLVVHSLLAWITIAAATWFGIRSIGADVSFGAVLVILPMLVLGVAVPTPGGAGSYHGAMKVALMLFGVSELLAVSAGFLIHALITVPVILGGMALLWFEKISWRELLAAASQVRRLGSPADGPNLTRAMENAP